MKLISMALLNDGFSLDIFLLHHIISAVIHCSVIFTSE